jgi:hypothetical protein
VAKNYYFENFENSMEQSLIEDLVIESIKIYGMDAWYIPRTKKGQDPILNETSYSYIEYSEAHMLEMYVKSVDGFEGEGDFLSKFGLEIRDSVTLTVARRSYESEVATYRDDSTEDAPITRPLEGDLIYLPLNNKIFEIKHVEHESIFYQMGSLQMYDLRAELFEYSGEAFKTGQDFIDHNFAEVDIFVPSADVKYATTYDNGFFLEEIDNATVVKSTPVKNLFIELEIGRTYVFDQSDSSNTGQTIGIYTTIGAGTGELLDGQVSTGTPGTAGAKTTFNPPADIATNLNYYYRTNDGSSYGKVSIVSSRLENVESYDSLATNTSIETVADNIIDFSQMNPFGEDNF